MPVAAADKTASGLPPSAGTPGQPLTHLRLAAAGFLALIVVSALLMAGAAERVMTAEVRAVAQRHAIDLGRVVALAMERDLADLGAAEGPDAAALVARLTQPMADAAGALPVVRVDVIGRDGTIRLSTESRRIGQPAESASGVATALTGDIHSAAIDQRRFPLSGDRVAVSDHVVATYLPVRPAGPPGSVTAVLAVVQDVAPMMRQMASAQRKILLAGGAVLVVFALVVLVAARRLKRMVEAQRLAMEQQVGERQDALVHLKRVQDAMETTILERTRRLRESESRFRDFAEGASDWLWEIDEQMRYTFISDGFRRITGLDPVVFIGHQRSDLVDFNGPDDHERWRLHEETLRDRRAFRDLRYSLMLPDGQRRTVSAAGTPIIDDRGRFRGYRGTTTDITGSERAEQTINRMGRIIDQSANEVYIFDASTLRFSQVNRGARSNLGLDMETLSHMQPLDIMPQETAASLTRRLGLLRRDPASSSVFESVFRRQDGTVYPVEVRLQFMAHERPAVFIAVVQDTTERQQAQQALIESEERYRCVAEMSLDAIVVHVDGIVVFANVQAVIIAGAESTDDLVGQPLRRYIHSDYFGFMVNRLHTLTVTGRPTTRAELVLLRHDGTPFDAEASSSPIAYGGQPAVQTVIRDISETKAVQSQLIQTAKLATLGEMAAGMAHELSQPMNVIRMAAEGALLGHPEMSARVRDALGIVASQAGRMGDIIDHMRIFSRKEAEAEEVFDPGLCVRQALNMVEAQFLAEDIIITARYPDRPVAVRGRPVHLEQVLLNLLTNARDAVRTVMQVDDAVTLPGRISVDMRLAPGGEVVIGVQDSGGGIAADRIERVFEPFYTTKEVGTGTGLGLSVSFGLIAAMSGTIVVHNMPGENGRPYGACFEVRLPSAEAGAEVKAPRPGAAARGLAPDRSGEGRRAEPGDQHDHEDEDEPSALLRHVLVVDDEPFATKLVADHLRHLGYRVTAAGDGEEAYEAFLADPPDLVITDLRMPRLDGADLMQRIHSHVPDLPVILATGHLGHLEEASQALEDEAVAVVKKPLSLAALATLVRHHAGEPDSAVAPVG